MDKWTLEAKLIYALIVAGKSARFAEAAMGRLPFDADDPFSQIRRWREAGILDALLREARTGNYTKLSRALSMLVDSDIDLGTCSPADLETVPGIGPKTSRFFILWTRPGYRCAALDVHILRWLREQGYAAPRTTPSADRVYRELEEAFLAEADRRSMSARQLDLAIWSKYSGNDGVASASQAAATGSCETSPSV